MPNNFGIGNRQNCISLCGVPAAPDAREKRVEINLFAALGVRRRTRFVRGALPLVMRRAMRREAPSGPAPAVLSPAGGSNVGIWKSSYPAAQNPRPPCRSHSHHRYPAATQDPGFLHVGLVETATTTATAVIWGGEPPRTTRPQHNVRPLRIRGQEGRAVEGMCFAGPHGRTPAPTRNLVPTRRQRKSFFSSPTYKFLTMFRCLRHTRHAVSGSCRSISIHCGRESALAPGPYTRFTPNGSRVSTAPCLR